MRAEIMVRLSARLTEAQTALWATRERLEHAWRTPGMLDSLRFATTEGGEAELALLLGAWLLAIAEAGDVAGLRLAYVNATQAIDGALRGDASYSRNRDKTISVRTELADAAMMLLTALGPEYKFAYHAPQREPVIEGPAPSLERVVDMTSMALSAAILGEAYWTVSAHGALLEIAGLLGDDFLPVFQARLARKEAKVADLVKVAG